MAGLPRRATVIREGQQFEVDAAELVPGDLLVLGAGDQVSADLRTVEARSLRVDTSTLTGESVPTTTQPMSRLFAGSFIVEGEGRAVVVATGERTRLAEIAR